MPHARLGQHFLIDHKALEAVVRAVSPDPDDTVLEIGTGTGILTRALAQTGCRVISIEKDAALANQARTACVHMPRVTILQGDILKLDISALRPTPLLIAGNIPYYLTGKLIRLMVEEWPMPRRIVLMIQREVAQRLIDAERFSKLSVFAQLYGTVAIVRTLPPQSFSPQPKVFSSIITITPHGPIPPELADKRFKTLIHKAFSSPRKYALNNLKPAYNETLLNEAFKTLHIAQNARAETIAPRTWLALFHMLETVRR